MLVTTHIHMVDFAAFSFSSSCYEHLHQMISIFTGFNANPSGCFNKNIFMVMKDQKLVAYIDTICGSR